MEMDIDTLAGMVAEGFSSVAARFDELEEKIEKRMDSLEKEVRFTNQHIDRIVMPLLDSHATRIKDMELKLT